MRKTIGVTLLLTALVSLTGLLGMRPAWIGALWIGAVWGVADLYCWGRATRCMAAGRYGWPLAGWLTLKFAGLYGLAAWLLVVVRISAVGWLVGFTLSLVGLFIGSFASLRPLFSSSARTARALALVLPAWSGLAGLFCPLAHAAEAAHDQAGAAHPPEIPNLITLLTHWMPEGPVSQFLHTWENGIFAFVIVGLVGGLMALGARSLALLPARGQMAVEAVVQAVHDFVCGILGPREGRRYLPFLGTLFLFILAMNLAGVVPGLKSPTSRFEMTGALALCVFGYVQWTALRRRGIFGYLYHLVGEPRDLIGWGFAPLMLFIHVIGELVKPLSLSLRLFGNVMGEDTLLGAFAMLGALCFAWTHLPVGIPLHFPFVLLALIFGVVQALVFATLSTIYIYQALPHEEH